MRMTRTSLLCITLLLYHLFFAYVGWNKQKKKNGDAYHYWFIGENLSDKSWSEFLRPGTNLVKFFTFPFVRYLQMPFWSGFMIFSLISSLGFWILFKMVRQITSGNMYLFAIGYFCLLMPNFHLWTSIIGKEAILIVPLIIMLHEMYMKKYFSFLIIISFFCLAIIRPHVSFIFVLSYVISIILTRTLSLKNKTILFVGLIGCTGLLALLLTQLQDFSGGIPQVIRKYEAHISYFKKTKAYVPLDDYSISQKIFTFYFRPLPFEKNGFLYQVISIENILLLIIVVLTIACSIKYFRTLKEDMLFVFPIVFMIFLALMYIYAYANYGIILRTRTMTTPFLYIFIIKVLSIIKIKSTAKEV